MKIGFVCNDIETEEDGYTTTRLGQVALEMGHEPWLFGVGDLANDPDDSVRAWGRRAAMASARVRPNDSATLENDTTTLTSRTASIGSST